MTAVPRDPASVDRHRPRLTDRVEDVAGWALMVAGLLLLVGAWASGRAVQSQLTEQAVVGGMVVGFNVLLVGAAVLVGTWTAVRRLTASVNAARWESEWARVGPEWSGHAQ